MSLLELTVVDLALLERVRVRLRPGLTVLTGETGAGKSLLIDALGLALGARADVSLVRHGSELARVEALFEVAGRDEPLIAAREVTSAGRSVARLDDEAVTVARLAETTGGLAEIHGQHEQQRLLAPAWQRELLDAFGRHRALRQVVREAVAAWRDNRATLDAMPADPAELQRRIELAEHTAAEIEAVGMREGEVAELQAALAAAAHAETIGRLDASLRERLVGEGGGARDVLARAAREALELARLERRYEPLVERLEGLAAEVEDAALELRRMTGELELEPGRLATMEERLGRLYSLLRKYGESEAAVLEAEARSRVEAARLRGMEAERARRLAADELLERQAREAAAALSDARRASAATLAQATAAHLHALGLGQAALTVEVVASALSGDGADEVAFRFAPNPGEPPLPLARIASGGELSRVSLALKCALAGADATPTLIFDEIDAGIGGRSAEPVGRLLRQLAEGHQVLVVTHLPQIAAYADHHLLVEKGARGRRTVTQVHELAGEERVAELAAMLGSAESAARDTARALLVSASPR